MNRKNKDAAKASGWQIAGALIIVALCVLAYFDAACRWHPATLADWANLASAFGPLATLFAVCALLVAFHSLRVQTRALAAAQQSAAEAAQQFSSAAQSFATAATALDNIWKAYNRRGTR